MNELTSHLRELITQNSYKAFFDHWEANIHPTSTLNHHAHQLKAIWGQLKSDTISGLIEYQEQGVRQAKLTDGLLRLINSLSSVDFEPAKTCDATPDPLQDLMHRKLAMLRRERILATDAAVKFKLDLEIEELEQQLI